MLAPDAWPSCSGRTDESTRFAIGAKNSAMPTPARMNGTTSELYGVVGVETAAIQPRAIACSVSPMLRIRLGLMRSDIAPAIGATNIGASVHGRIRRPEPSGE